MRAMIRSGFDLVDKSCGGLTPGEVLWVRGEDGGGKTISMINSCLRTSCAYKRTVYFVAHDRTDIELGQDVALCASGVGDQWRNNQKLAAKLDKGRQPLDKNFFMPIDGQKEDVMAMLERAAVWNSSNPGVLYVDDLDSASDSLVSRAEDWVRAHGWAGVFSCLPENNLSHADMRLDVSRVADDGEITFQFNLLKPSAQSPAATCSAVLDPKTARLTYL